MSAILKNDLGKIAYSEDYVASIAGISATECYGLVGMSQKNIGEALTNLFKSDNLKKGVRVKTDETENIVIELFITVKYGVSLSAVAENIIDRVKYSVEKETGLNVSSVDIIVQGIQI
ncbi:MAG: Asp23/Gls24 family envelope stress response protein [Christensenellaceae bacterium]